MKIFPPVHVMIKNYFISYAVVASVLGVVYFIKWLIF